MTHEPDGNWGRWADRFLTWGTLTTVVAVALVGLALLTTARHPARHDADGSSSVLMANPIGSERPSIELHKADPTDPKTCAGGTRPPGNEPCPARSADAAGH
jgi:hypothetical protein